MKQAFRLAIYLIALVFMPLFISSCGGGNNGGSDETPNAPSNVQAVLLNGNIRVSWEHDNKNVVGFSIYRNEGSPIGENAQNAEKIGETKADIKFYIDDASLDPNKQYSYSVAAKGATTESARVAIEEPIQPAPKTGDFRVRALFGGAGGKGTIKSTDNAINCTEPGGAKCSSDFQTGTTVTLEASPATGSEFIGWQGVDCSGTGPCNVSVSAVNDPNNDSIIEVTALFNQTGYLLSVDKRGTGTGTIVSTPSGIDCGADCEEAYLIPAQGNAATKVGFSSVTVADGSLFNGWGGACPTAAATSSCVVTMDADKTVEAFFSKPTADSYTVGEGETLNQAAPGVLVNDVALAGGVELDTDPVQDPENGTLTLEADGSFTYQHDGSNTTSDSFSYRVSDGRGNEAEISVSLTITPSNDPPVAEDDVYAVAEDVTKNVPAADGVLKNDSDEDGDELSAELRTNVTKGTLTLRANGSFIYTPNTNFSGTDTFTYVAKAGGQESAPATVTITVSDSNDPPVAANGTATVLEDETVEITLSANDAETSTLNYEIVAPPANGTLTGTGKTRTYEPDPNFNGSDSFTFKANDGNSDSNTATVTITVTAVNDPPTLSLSGNPPTTTAGAGERTVANFATASPGPADESGQEITFELTRTDTDGGLAFTAQGAPSISSNGTLTYTPRATSSGSASYDVVASDGAASSAVRRFTITVNPGPSVVSVDVTPATASLQEGSVQQLTATVVVTGGADDSVTWTSSNPGVATVSSTGLVTAVSASATAATITATSVADSTKSDSAAITVTAAPNPSPIATNGSATVLEDGSVSITLTATDDGDALTYTIVSLPTNGTLNGTGETRTYTPDANFNGNDSFTFRANDGNSNSNVATVNVTVTPVNDAPSFSLSQTAVDAADGNIANFATNINKGAANEAAQTLSFTVTRTPPNGGLVFDTDPTISPTGALSYSVQPGSTGSASFNIVLNDSGGTANGGADTSTAKTFTITADPPEEVVSVTVTPATASLQEGSVQQLTATVVVTGGADDSVTWTSSNPNIATVSVTGLVTAVSASATAATITATSVADPTKSDSAAITVFAANQAPTADAGPNQTNASVGVEVDLDGSNSSDADGTITGYAWQLLSQPDTSVAALTSPNTATTSFTPDVVGNYIARLTVTDSDNATDLDTVTITATVAPIVTSVNVEPDDPEVDKGNTGTLEAKVETQGNAPTTVEWSSSDETIASVTSDGVVEGLSPGEARISATSTFDEEKADTVILTVNGVVSVAISSEAVTTLVLEQTETLEAIVETFGDVPDRVIWSSNQPDIASIGVSSGRIRAEEVGEAVITATSEFDASMSADITIRVIDGDDDDDDAI